MDTDPQEAGIGGTEGAFPEGIGAESVPTALSSSVRTLILGIDYDGRIVQHDRTAPRILAREPDELLGAQLSDLTARPPDGAAAIAGCGGDPGRPRGHGDADRGDPRRAVRPRRW